MTQVRTESKDTQAEAPPFFGARISLHPMTDRYVPVILEAIKGLQDTGLEVERGLVGEGLEALQRERT